MPGHAPLPLLLLLATLAPSCGPAPPSAFVADGLVGDFPSPAAMRAPSSRWRTASGACGSNSCATAEWSASGFPRKCTPAPCLISSFRRSAPRPNEDAYRGPWDGIVLLEPVGSRDSFPLDVKGYARTFEGHVAAKLVRGDTVLADTFTTAGGGIETWGEFRMRFEAGPGGALRLLVSGEDPVDEAERPRARGLDVPLTIVP